MTVGGSGGGARNHIVALDNSTKTIDGSGFNFPLGALDPLSGNLTGFLSDGSSIDWQFSRDASAQIFVVPEPTSATLCLLGTIAHVFAYQLFSDQLSQPICFALAGSLEGGGDHTESLSFLTRKV